MVRWLERLEDGLFLQSRDMGPPWGGLLRIVRYPAALIRDWLRGEISVQAMSLAYTTLLSLVPLMVFSFSILKGLGARGDLHFLLHQFFKPLGASASQATDTVMQFVTNMRGDLLGSLGLGFLVYTVITTIQKIESSFNFVWHVERPRSFARRFTEYLSVMILAPILLAVGLGLIGTAEHSPFALWVQAYAPMALFFSGAGRVLPYVIVTLAFTAMYIFIPNTRVQLRAALVGGVMAGLIWALVGKVFATVIVYSSQLVAVYTGFALVLTTLIWVYLSWLILLIGAQLAFYVQFPQYLRHGQSPIELTGRDREQVALSVMLLIAADYTDGRTKWTATRLARELDIPGKALSSVLQTLEKSGFLLVTEQEQFVPGRDLDGIRIADVLEAVRRSPSNRLDVKIRPVGAAVATMSDVEAAIIDSLKGRTIKQMSTAE